MGLPGTKDQRHHAVETVALSIREATTSGQEDLVPYSGYGLYWSWLRG